MDAMSIQLVRAPIDLTTLQATKPADGALCLFVGVVRDHNEGRRVLRLEYESYEEMALPLMERIAAECRERWRVTDVRIVHRLGPLAIGEASVAVAGAAPPPREALEACRHANATLNARGPLWKKELYAHGSPALIEQADPGHAP